VKLASAAILASICLLPAASRAADDNARIRAIVDAAVRPLMAEYDLPGMAVGVTVDGTAHLFSYGLASKEDKIPVSAATLFELGSVTKPMTATLASYAQVLGKLSLADHPGKYLPQLKGSPIDKASLLNLATYTAGGLPLQFPDEVADGQMVAYFQRWQPDAAPSTQRRYSNPSLGLLGHVTALALHGNFSDLMEKQLFPQFGMKDTHMRGAGPAPANYAWGYDSANKPVRVSPGVLAAEAYGALATAADVLRFVQANIAPGQLAAPMRRAVEGTHTGYFAVGPMVQGLGWEQYRYPVALADLVAGTAPAMAMEGHPAKPLAASHAAPQAILFNKTGSTRGFASYVAFVPKMKMGVVLLANKGYPTAARVTAGHTILERLASIKE
jgi:beta-lactamase class C